MSDRDRKAAPARGRDERPPAPWGAFPLAELTVLAGIVSLLALDETPLAVRTFDEAVPAWRAARPLARVDSPESCDGDTGIG